MGHILFIGITATLGPPNSVLTGKETVIREMKWIISDESEGQVKLVFVGAPHHFQELESKELQAWLKSCRDPTLNATFTVTRDFGRVRSSSLDSIEGWTGDLSGALRAGGVGCGGDLPDCSTPPEERKQPW